MPTLQELRKRKYATIKAFAQALGVSATKAGMMLQGRYNSAMSVQEVNLLAVALGVDFQTCTDAMSESYKQWCATWQTPAHLAPIIQERRSPLDILIDRAVGKEK